MKKYNKLLQRQINRKLKDTTNLSPELLDLLDTISASYDHYERDRQIIDRSIELSSIELQESNQENLKTQALLEAKNRELSQFVTIASHDLKTPLRTIQSFTNLLSNKLEDSNCADISEFIYYIKDGVQTMSELLDDLLVFAMAGKEIHSREEIDVNALIQHVLQHLYFDIKETETKLFVQENLPIVQINYSQGLQLFQNLIHNAIKYRSEETPQIQIKVEYTEDRCIFAIQDNGIGIEETFQKRIFDGFYQLNGKKGVKNTGLGLAICKKIVESWGGNIWCESKMYEGSIFYFSLPMECCIVKHEYSNKTQEKLQRENMIALRPIAQRAIE